jgi:hypothetical protein
VMCHRAGKTAVKLKLTRQGIKLLKAGKSVKITATASFTLAGGNATSTTKTTTLDH